MNGNTLHEAIGPAAREASDNRSAVLKCCSFIERRKASKSLAQLTRFMQRSQIIHVVGRLQHPDDTPVTTVIDESHDALVITYI